MDLRIGIIPSPVYVLLASPLTGFSFSRHVTSDIPTMVAVLAVGGFTCAELGKRSPILRDIGSAAILATFVPSALPF